MNPSLCISHWCRMRGWKYTCGDLWISVLNAKWALYAVYVYIHPPQPLTGKSYTTENKVTTVSYFSRFQKGENDRIWKQNVYIAKKTPNKTTTTTSFISLVTELWHCGVMCILHNCEAIGISAALRIKEPQIHCQRSRRKMKKKKIKSSRTTLMQKHWWFKSSLGANLS